MIDLLHAAAVYLTLCLAMGWFPCQCCAPTCGICGGGDFEVDVTFSGFSNGTCSDCLSFNNTFTLTQISDCTWLYEFGSTTCDVYQIRLGLSCSGTDVALTMTITGPGILNHKMIYGATILDDDCVIDCPLSITDANTGGSSPWELASPSPECDGSAAGNATITFTAI